MAKKFVRSITGIANINEQDMDTNNVGDLLSDGQDIYVHRKTPNGDEYYNLTSGKAGGGTTTPAEIETAADGGLTSWKESGKTKLKLSEEFLKNNAQYIGVEGELKATPRQDKYGKSYTLGLADSVKATLVKASTAELLGGDGVKVTKNGTYNTVATVAIDKKKVMTPACLDHDLHDGIYVTDLLQTSGEVHLGVDSTAYLKKSNLSAADGCGLVVHDNKPNELFMQLDIDSTRLLRHDCLLASDDSGIKVTHENGKSTTSLALSDDVKAKLAKVDQLSAGGGTVTPATPAAPDDNKEQRLRSSDGSIIVIKGKNNTTDKTDIYVDPKVVVTRNTLVGRDGVKITKETTTTSYKSVVTLDDTTKATLAKVDPLETKMTALETKVDSLPSGGGTSSSTALEPFTYSSTNLDSSHEGGLSGTVFGIPYANGTKYHMQITIVADHTKVNVMDGEALNIDDSNPISKWLQQIPHTKEHYQVGNVVLEFISQDLGGGVCVDVATMSPSMKTVVNAGTFNVDVDASLVKDVQ